MKDGTIELPSGKIASVVTYLEMTAPPGQTPPPRALPEGVSVRRVEHPDPGWYRALFRAVGEPWIWFSRLRMPEQELSGILSDPRVLVWALAVQGKDKGILELDARALDEVEVAFLGVTPDLMGQGFGGVLMRLALEQAWRRNPKRVFLHTCTLDHPGAVPFYRKWGFRPYKRAIEVAEDPRLRGECDRSAAPHFPLIEG